LRLYISEDPIEKILLFFALFRAQRVIHFCSVSEAKC